MNVRYFQVNVDDRERNLDIEVILYIHVVPFINNEENCLNKSACYLLMFEKYKKKGITGLANLGNTRFINSVLQCLSHTYELNDFLEKNDGMYKRLLNRVPESLILIEWDKLRRMMWDENCTISPGGFVLSIRKIARIKDKPLFTGFAQNDLTEFLNFLMDCFHSAISREVEMEIKGETKTKKDTLAKKCYTMMKNMYKKEYSEILGFFYGIHVSTIRTIESQNLSEVPEPFFMLQLEIPKDESNPTMKDCLDAYTGHELLEGENMYFNEKQKKKQKAFKNIHFWNMPEILIIVLKRFVCENGRSRKIDKNVSFDLNELDLSQYMIGYNKKKYVYTPYGICNHSGGVAGGHYTSFVKTADDKWYHFNDTVCTEIVNTKNIVSNKAYCFFYRKKKN